MFSDAGHLIELQAQLINYSVGFAPVGSTAHKNRVATAQGKQGIWFLLFPDRENTGNSVLTQGKIC